MMKYGLWSDDNDQLVLKLSKAVEETGVSNCPSYIFAPSVFIVAFRESNKGGVRTGKVSKYGLIKKTR